MAFSTATTIGNAKRSGICEYDTTINDLSGAPNSGATYSDLYGASRITVHATGTFGAAGNVKVQKSHDGTNWADTAATAIASATPTASLAAADLGFKFYKLVGTAGDNTTALTVRVVGTGYTQ